MAKRQGSYGTDGDDFLIGSDRSDNLYGGNGNDRLSGLRGNDVLDGGAGIDTAIFGGARANYLISGDPSGWKVRDNTGLDGTDSLYSIERLQFADGTCDYVNGAWVLSGQASLADTAASTPSLSTAPGSGNEDGPIALAIAAALSDLDGSETLTVTVSGVPLGASLSAGTSNGTGGWTLTAAQLGNLTITPPANYSGSFTLQVTATAREANGGAASSVTGNLTVNVSAVADAPNLATQAAGGYEDQAISLGSRIIASPTDTDGSETLSIVVSGMPAGATLGAGTKSADGTWMLTSQQLADLTLTPPPNSAQDFTLTITAVSREANGSTAQAVQTLPVTVTAVNDRPDAVADSFTAAADQSFISTSSLLSNDSDPDGDPLSVVAYDATSAHGGAVSVNDDGLFTFTPASGFAGADSFTYTVDDGAGGRDTATVAITVADAAGTPYYVEDLLLPEWNRLNYPAGYGTADVVTYTFLDAVPGYYSSSSWVRDGFRAFSAQQQDATRDALDMISSYTNLTFVETTAAQAEMTFGIADNPNATSGLAYWPSYDGVGKIDSDVWIDADFAGDAFPAGSYIYATLLHEIGHAIGLDHPSLPTAENTHQYTVMASLPHATMTGEPTTHMLYDIAAVQYLYGANTQHATGNDVYDFASLDGKISTLWDAGGHDTLDLSAATHGVTIDLRDGHFSTIAPSGSNNVAIAFNAIIEDVVGGSYNDTLQGNDVGNLIAGRAGDDRLTGFGGADIFDFDANWGHDVVVDFRPGEDHLDLRDSGASWNTLQITSNGTDTQIAYGDGLVTLLNVATVTDLDLLLVA